MHIPMSDDHLDNQDCIEEEEAVFYYAIHDLLDVAEQIGAEAFSRKVRRNFPHLVMLLCGECDDEDEYHE